MPSLRLRILLSALSTLLLATCAFADLSKLDPLARRALALVQGGATPEQLRDKGVTVNAAGELDVFIVGQTTRQELEAAGARVRTALPGIFTAFVPAGSLDAVAALPGVAAIDGAALVEPEIDASVPATGAASLRGAGPVFAGMNGAGVIVGDVDTGVDYDHGDFKDAGGNTRLINIWDQTVSVGTPPPAYGYGAEWTSADINAHLSTEVDVNGHGTHVMGIAGGDGSSTGGAVPAFTYVGMAPKADLIMVETTFQNTAIVDGVAYIFARASALSKNAVVNLSLGSHFGPHDGTSAFEAGLSALSGPGRVIVKSAGNERSATNIRHADVFAAGAGTNCTMSVSGSQVGRVIGIDGYYEASENLNVQITTPSGTVIGPLALGGINAVYPGALTPNGRVYLENGATLTATGDKEVYIEINATGTTSNGTWTFRFIPVALGPALGEVDLWRFFNTTGINGNFVLGADNGKELVSEPGNAVELITTAAYTTKQNWTACNGVSSTFSGTPAPGNLATFSSPGPTRDGRQKPDITAPGTAIGSATSFDLSQVCPSAPTPAVLLPDGNQHTMNAGTSMAAPHTAGAVALLMQKYGAITPAFAKSYIATHAIVDGMTGAVPNRDWGGGKLHLGDLLDPTVNVIFPNGGETLLIGGNATLQWLASDNVGVTQVNLQLSRNGVFGPFENIALGVPNTGNYSWVVSGPATNDAVLRVSAGDAEGNVGIDQSDYLFAIVDLATPTQLSMFRTEWADGGIELRWQFADPAEFPSVAVERAPSTIGPWAAADVERRSEGNTGVAIDRSVGAGSTWYYRLLATSRSGQTTTFGPLSGTAGAGLGEFALSAASPNPTTGLARFEYTVPRPAVVKISVLDLQGREVARLTDGWHRAGRYQAEWSGDLARGAAPAGLYFVRMLSPGRHVVQRVVIAR